MHDAYDEVRGKQAYTVGKYDVQLVMSCNTTYGRRVINKNNTSVLGNATKVGHLIPTNAVYYSKYNSLCWQIIKYSFN